MFPTSLFVDTFKSFEMFFSQNLLSLFSNVWLLTNPKILVDIIIVSLFFYVLYTFLKGTKAFNMFVGILFIILLGQIALFFRLVAVNLVINYVLTLIFVAIPIVFQPELRNALEYLGRNPLALRGGSSFLTGKGYASHSFIRKQIKQAVLALSKEQKGALFVFEQETGLREYYETGTIMKAVISSKIIQSIFVPKGPLHDGAMIIHRGHIMAAGCVLPVTERKINRGGLRHRAAIGITEQSDAVVLLVSEERGTIHKVIKGRISDELNEKRLEFFLLTVYPDRPNIDFFSIILKSFQFPKTVKNVQK